MQRVLFITVLLLMTIPAKAQDGLIDIYEQALVSDPAIREAEADYLATSEVKAQARGQLLPFLSLSGSRGDGHSENPDPPPDPFTGEPSDEFSSSESDSESSSLQLSLSQTIFDWSRYVTLKQADKTVLRAETTLAAARQDLMRRVAEAYFGVLTAEDQLAAEISARDSIEQQLTETQRRYDTGLIAITDVQEARAGYDEALAQVIAAERRVAAAQEALREIIDTYAVDLRTPIAELPLQSPDPEDIEAWVAMAREQNLSLASSRIAADISEDGIKLSRSSRIPTFQLSASTSDASFTSTQTTNRFVGAPNVTDPIQSQRQSTNLSLSFSVPIFSGGTNRSRIRQSVYQHRGSLEALARTARLVERQTRDAYLGVTSQISLVEALQQALESARTALNATEAGFDVGQRTSADIVRAQNAVTRAETAYASARYNYLLNTLTLKQAAGSLSEADLAEIDAWLE